MLSCKIELPGIAEKQIVKFKNLMMCWKYQVCEYQGLETPGLEAVFILRTFFNTVEILAVGIILSTP